MKSFIQMPVNLTNTRPSGEFETYRIQASTDDGSLQGRLFLATDTPLLTVSGKLSQNLRPETGLKKG